MKILALSPHPDDVEIGAGGFLLSAIDKGAEVHVVYCLYEKIVVVENNAKQFNYNFSWLKNTTSKKPRPEYNSDTVKSLDNILYADTYTHLLIPHYGDSHQDHKTVNALAQSSARRFNGMILQYEVALYANRNFDFKPTIFFGIDKYIDQKREWATSYHDVSMNNWETVHSLNRVRGNETDDTYAEAFELLKWSNFSI